MKILYLARESLFVDPGGDTVQIVKTADALRGDFDCEIEIHCGHPKTSCDEFDLIHCFNLCDANEFCSLGNYVSRKIILSPIYVDYSVYESSVRRGVRGVLVKFGGRDFGEYAKNLVKFALRRDRYIDWRYVLLGHRRAVKKMLNDSVIVLPNSKSEADRIRSDYGEKFIWRRIVNAVDSDIFDFENVVPDERFNGGVVCVGRVEGRKGQLDLIRALHGTEYKLFIVGNPARNDPSYYRACRSAAGANVSFIPFCDQKKLAPMLKAARVHVLPSWFETTGLVSLEAAAMGCSVVVSHMGDTEEYFSDFAEFCSPGDLNSIREAVNRAYARDDGDRVAKLVTEKYTWKLAAQETYAAYEYALGHRSDSATR